MAEPGPLGTAEAAEAAEAAAGFCAQAGLRALATTTAAAAIKGENFMVISRAIVNEEGRDQEPWRTWESGVVMVHTGWPGMRTVTTDCHCICVAVVTRTS